MLTWKINKKPLHSIHLYLSIVTYNFTQKYEKNEKVINPNPPRGWGLIFVIKIHLTAVITLKSLVLIAIKTFSCLWKKFTLILPGGNMTLPIKSN